MPSRIARSLSKSTLSSVLAKCSIALLLAPYISPVLLSLEWKTQYTYANEYREVSLAQHLRLESPKNSFVVELKTTSEIENEDAVIFTVSAGGISKEAGLDIK